MSVLDRPRLQPDAAVRYGDGVDQVADVYLPGPGVDTGPVGRFVLLVHGGFWRDEFDRGHLGPLARGFTYDGWVVAVPEYARSGPHAPAGCWLQTSADLLTAVRTLPGLVAGLLGRALATPVLVGHSAGGHLALWLAAQPGPPGVAGVVALAPVADLRAAYDLDLDAGAVRALLGGGPDHAKFEAAEPMAQPPRVPVVVVHGALDAQVPIELSRRYQTAHPAARLVELPDTDHFALIDPDGVEGALVRRLAGELG